MNSLVFIFIVVTSGAAAGAIYGALNLAIVEPYLDVAINIENQNLFESGEADDTFEFWIEYDAYRTWQKSGQVLGSIIMGVSIGALFGIVYSLFRRVIPGGHDIRKALLLAAIMWLTLFVVPALKYPANPPTVGETETVEIRTMLYIALIAISGLLAIGFYLLSRRLRGYQKLSAAAGYGILMGVILIILPENPDAITAPADLIWGYRIAAAATVSAYWLVLPLFFGSLWKRLDTDRQLISENS